MIEKFWILWQQSLSINSYRVYKTAGSWSSRSYKSTAVLHCEWNSTSNCMSIHTVCQAWLPKTACISGETKKRSPSAAGDRTKVVNQTHKAGWRQSWKREEFTVLKESTGDKSTEGKKKKRKWPGGWMWGSSQKKGAHRELSQRGKHSKRQQRREREGPRESFFEEREGGPFLLLGFCNSAQLRQKAKSCAPHFSYHVVTFSQARGQACSNESPRAASNERW